MLPASKSDQSQLETQHEKVSLILMMGKSLCHEQNLCLLCMTQYWKYGNSQTCGFRSTLRTTCCKTSQARGDESMQNWASWWSKQRKLRCDDLRTGNAELSFFFWSFFVELFAVHVSKTYQKFIPIIPHPCKHNSIARSLQGLTR